MTDYRELLVGNACEVLNLYVLDTAVNHIHKIGTDEHDALYFEDNKIKYYNLQNGGGCTLGKCNYDGWYEFSNEKDWCVQRIKELEEGK